MQPGRKAQWFRDAAATLKGWPEFKGVAYFHVHLNQGCPRWFDSSDSSLAAFREMALDPYFNPPPATSPARDLLAPTAPVITSADATNARVALTWAASSDNVAVTQYNLYRNGQSLASVAGTETSYTDHTVSPSTDYSYVVEAEDQAGNKASSLPRSVRTQDPPADTTPPAAPTGLQGAATSTTDVSLSWNAASDPSGIASYNVYRDGTVIATVDTTSYPDRNLTPGVTYRYEVDAVDGAGNVSPRSAPVSITVPSQPPPDTTPPQAPTGLTATATGPNQVDLAWNAALDDVGVMEYRVYRNGALLASLDAVTSYTDTAVTASTTYKYSVTALDAAKNESPKSAPASVQTPAPPRAFLLYDGFESGTLSQWPTQSGVIAQQVHHVAGSWGAQAQASGSPAYAQAGLPTAKVEVFYRLWFKTVKQQSSSIVLQQLLTSGGGKILSVYITSQNKIGYKNETTGASTTSSAVATPFEWHKIMVRVLINGSSSKTQVWLDGSELSALRKTHRLGTTPVGRVQFGDSSSGRSFDIAFDEVAVDDVVIT